MTTLSPIKLYLVQAVPKIIWRPKLIHPALTHTRWMAIKNIRSIIHSVVLTNRAGLIPPGPECHYCKKRGHVMAECWHLKNNSQGQQQAFKSDTLVTQTQLPSASSLSVVQGQSTSYSRNAEYTPSISRGYKSIPSSTSQIPITVLRDTGTNQSLLIETKLPCTAETSTRCEVLIQGVELTQWAYLYIRCSYTVTWCQTL